MPDCKQCKSSFEITDEDRKFYDRISPIIDDKKYSIPEPTLCSDCRYQRRIAVRNESNLYSIKCHLCGKKMFSLHDNNEGRPIFCSNCWYEGNWNAFDYGRNFDFSKPFFEQYYELGKTVPVWGNMNIDVENSDYSIYCYGTKNCYLLRSSGLSEDCFYGMRVIRCRDVVDCLNVSNSELCYECVDCDKLNNCEYLQNSKNCSECNYSKGLTNCRNCFMCSDISNMEYCILNNKLSKEVYEEQKREWLAKGRDAILDEINMLSLKVPHKYSQNFNSENCYGDFIYNSKNIKNGFFLTDSEDSGYVFDSDKVILSMDCSNVDDVTECYEIGTTFDGSHYLFSNTSVGLIDSYYCSFCINSSDCFGCIGLHRKEHCILNKQYSKEEYAELVPKIIEHMQSTGEWGEFFPISISLFAYNETLANVYYPLTKDEAEKKGWKWKEFSHEMPDVIKTISAKRLPDSIGEIPDDILNWAILCEATGRPFRIIAQELKFYRKMGLSIPHLHPDERYKERMNKRNPRKLFIRKCDKCRTDIRTTYSPDRPEKVYCEKCYLQSVY